MAFTPHTLVTIGGALTEETTADEIWQIGIRGINPLPPASPVDPAQLTAFLSAITDPTTGIPGWYTAAQSGIPSSVLLQYVKVVNIGPDGKYTTPPQQVTYNTAGTYAQVPGMPSFNSVALSWTTARKFGRLLRFGRVYPPNFAYSIQPGTAKIATAAQTQAVTSAKALLSAVAKSGSGFQFQPCVMSSKGGFEPITGVRVGDAVDVQRRRKDKANESYVTSVWP